MCAWPATSPPSPPCAGPTRSSSPSPTPATAPPPPSTIITTPPRIVSAAGYAGIEFDPVTGAANTTTVLITNLVNCEFKRWQLGTTGPASNDVGTDQLQLRLTIRATAVTAVAANNLVVSARYVLRNHKSNTSLP